MNPTPRRPRRSGLPVDRPARQAAAQVLWSPSLTRGPGAPHRRCRPPDHRDGPPGAFPIARLSTSSLESRPIVAQSRTSPSTSWLRRISTATTSSSGDSPAMDGNAPLRRTGPPPRDGRRDEELRAALGCRPWAQAQRLSSRAPPIGDPRRLQVRQGASHQERAEVPDNRLGPECRGPGPVPADRLIDRARLQPKGPAVGLLMKVTDDLPALFRLAVRDGSGALQEVIEIVVCFGQGVQSTSRRAVPSRAHGQRDMPGNRSVLAWQVSRPRCPLTTSASGPTGVTLIAGSGRYRRLAGSDGRDIRITG